VGLGVGLGNHPVVGIEGVGEHGHHLVVRLVGPLALFDLR
jgi:hypothetical protein